MPKTISGSLPIQLRTLLLKDYDLVRKARRRLYWKHKVNKDLENLDKDRRLSRSQIEAIKIYYNPFVNCDPLFHNFIMLVQGI